MHTAALARHLDSLGLVVFDRAGADCFLQDLPPEPVDAVGVYATAAPRGDLSPYVWMGAQLIVRTDGAGGRARSGYDRAAGLYQALHGLRHVTLAEGTADELRLLRCLATTDSPVGLGVDENHRPKWSVSFDCYVTNPTPQSVPG